MSSQSAAPRDAETLEAVLAAVAVWVMKYRYAIGLRDEQMKCRPEDVARRAGELAIGRSELAALASKDPQSAALLEKLLRGLGVEPGRLRDGNPLIMRDLLRLCVTCVHRGRCEHDLATGTNIESIRAYCPNAFALDTLIKGA